MTSTVNTEPWERNAVKHADERLNGTRDPQWWYTGIRPEPGRCPGVAESGEIRALPLPDLSVCSREEVLDYFDNAWTLHEVMFAGLKGAEAFYRPPDHNLRHPMIFYYGHTTSLYVNKLRVSGLLDAPIDAYLEHILEMGVDENSWDDMSKNEMVWPSVSEVKDYRAEVYRTVVGIIETTPFAPDLGRPVTMNDQAWALLLSIEHDRIHLETSSVLIREMRSRLVERPAAWPSPSPLRRTTETGKPEPGSVPANGTVTVPGRTAQLGKPLSFPSYGWDSAYGSRRQELPDFEAARCLVSNGEFHGFVADGGYRRPELWSAEGEAWRRFRNTKWPRFWIPTGPTGLHAFRLRTLFDEIDMPWDWPVVVNYHEAKAFAAWRSEKEGRDYRLPTEAEYFLLRDLPERPGVADDVIMRLDGAQLREAGVNLGLAWGSEGPVDHSPTTSQGLHDAGGNLWTWSEDTFNPLEGFTPHPYYEDFSVPSYGGQHQLILGGAYISTGELGSIWARHFYRPHFLQQAGIRLVVAPESTVDSEARAELDRVLLGQYGTAEQAFGRAGHPLAATAAYPDRLTARFTEAAAAAGVELRRVADLATAAGGLAFSLARHPVEVVGLDDRPSFITAADRLAEGTDVGYRVPGRGELHARRPSLSAGGSVSFVLAETARPPAALGTFDGAVVADAFDRLGGAAGYLRPLVGSANLLRAGGLLLVALPRASAAELANVLGEAFELLSEDTEPSLTRVDGRRYEITDLEVSIWRKR